MSRDIDVEALVVRATGYFREGYNCSQSVALAFAPYYGVDEGTMSLFSASFGAGIGRMRETCGAACAMFMLSALEFKAEDFPSAENKQRNYEAVQRLAAEFKAVAGSICCRELLGLNKKRADGSLAEISPVPEARTDKYYKKRPCIRMVETAVRIYCNYLNEIN